MDAGNLAPNLASLASVLVSLLSAVDKGDALSEVPTGLLGAVHILQLDQRGLGVLGVLGTLVSEMATLNVETIYKLEWMDRRYKVPNLLVSSH
jgi:hypothetical protein